MSELTMNEVLGTIRTLDSGNVELVLGNTSAEFTPAQVDLLARQLLHRAYPDQAMFIIPVTP